MSEENIKAETAAEVPATSTEEAAPKKKGKKKWPIVVGVVVVVLIAAGAGFWVWHEQPSFCNAICHTPMDAYNRTYDQEMGTEGVDKFGNTVADTSGMLAVTHRATNGDTCMSCHVPQLSEQITEGMNWISGNYEVVETQTGELIPTERTLKDLVEARGIASEEFCLNEACHANEDGSAMTRDDLIKATDSMKRNPHVQQHGEVSCDQCHKAHRASTNYCASCHSDSDLPEGWITPAEEKKLNKGN